MLQPAPEKSESFDVFIVLDDLLVVAQDALEIGGLDERDGELPAFCSLCSFCLVGEFKALSARVIAVGVDVVFVVEVGQ